MSDCLDALNRGEADIEALLQRYPQLRDELRPLLEVAILLRQRGARGELPPDFLDRLRERLLTASGRAQAP